MGRHFREGQGLCPIQVISSRWNEDLEEVQSYTFISMSLARIGLNTLTVAEVIPGVLHR